MGNEKLVSKSSLTLFKILVVLLSAVILIFAIYTISEKIIEQKIISYFAKYYESYTIFVQKETDSENMGNQNARYYFVSVISKSSSIPSEYIILYDRGEITVISIL